MLCLTAWVMNKKNFQNEKKSASSVTFHRKAHCCPPPHLWQEWPFTHPGCPPKIPLRPTGWEPLNRTIENICVCFYVMITFGAWVLEFDMMNWNAFKLESSPCIPDSCLHCIWPEMHEAVRTWEGRSDSTWTLGADEGPATVFRPFCTAPEGLLANISLPSHLPRLILLSKMYGLWPNI